MLPGLEGMRHIRTFIHLHIYIYVYMYIRTFISYDASLRFCLSTRQGVERNHCLAEGDPQSETVEPSPLEPRTLTFESQVTQHGEADTGLGISAALGACSSFGVLGLRWEVSVPAQ